MNIKYKIIFFLFLTIILLYIIHFVTSWMHTQKHKETFQNNDFTHNVKETNDKINDINNTIDKVKPITNDKDDDINFKFRMKILEMIDELHISDKTVKTNLIDYLFSDPIKNDLIHKSDADIKDKINSTYKDMSGVTGETQVINHIQYNDHKKEHFDDKIDTLINYVTNLLNGLKDLKNIPIRQESHIKETNTHLISPPRPEDTISKTKQEKIIEKYDNNINGIENTKQYAFF